MGYLTLTSILAGELIVVLMAFSKHLIPLKNYSRNIAKVQIFLSAFSVILALLDYLYVSNPYILLDMPYTMWTQRLAKLFLYMYGVFFVGSICRNIFDKKKTLEEVIFELNENEYTIKKDFDLVMGDFLYMPNVKAYCEFQDGQILFTGFVPAEEIDAKFHCRKIKDNLYECDYIECDAKTILGGIDLIVNYVAYVLAAFDVILLGIWMAGSEIASHKLIGNIIGVITCFIFGYAVNRIFANAKGFGAKLFYWFSYLLMIAGVLRLFIA